MSAPDLKVSIVQADTVWHNPQANRDYYQRVLSDQQAGNDIIVLPETFTSGFSNEALAQAETMQGETVAWMQTQATSLRAAVTGSVQIRDGERVFNRMIWAMPDGEIYHYDKRHLFRMAGEHERYCAGRDKIFIDYKGWRICPQICYDLRFPVYTRNRFNQSRTDDYDYDVLIYVANWPSPRHFAWQTLLKARAIENFAYVVGVNRTGSDANDLNYLGGSVVLDYLGQALVECGEQAQLQSAVISKEKLLDHRKRFPVYLDADSFELLD